MFSKLKEKLKKWTKKVSEEEEKVVESEKAIKNKEGTFEELTEEEVDEKLAEELKEGEYVEPEKKFNVGMETYQPDLEKTENKLKKIKQKKPGIFSKKKILTEEEFSENAEELEMILLENNVALEVAEKIIDKLKENLVGKELNKKEIEESIKENLKKIISEVLVEPFDIIKEIKEKSGPYIMVFCGINGVGKTTTIAKVANLLKEKGISSVLGAADTFRAAAVEQIKKHGENLGIKVIAQDYGSDPASVGFDAIQYAKKNNVDAVLIDTAGRIHTAKNLLKEMEKIKRVCNPDRTIFLGESITGNDAVDQVKSFDETIGIDGIILSKADIDEKGGTALSVGYITGKPILFLGTGQEYKNIEPFNKKEFLEKLGLD